MAYFDGAIFDGAIFDVGPFVLPGPVNYGRWPVNHVIGSWPVNSLTGAWPEQHFAVSWEGDIMAKRRVKPTGDVSGSLTSGGLVRTFIARVPTGLPAAPGLLLAFHGGGGTGPGFKPNIGLDALADQHKFIVGYPTAIGGNWTDGRAATAGGPDDVQFTRDLIAWFRREYGVNPAKVFVTGISNGGLFCHWLAYQSPSTIAGLASVAANILDSYVASITAPGPRMMFQGTADPLMKFLGGVNAALGPESYASTANSIAQYKTVNGAGARVTTSMPDLDPSDGCTVTKWDYPGGAYQVTAYIVNNGGHQWPGGNGNGVGASTNDISASALMVEMFHAYGLY